MDPHKKTSSGLPKKPSVPSTDSTSFPLADLRTLSAPPLLDLPPPSLLDDDPFANYTIPQLLDSSPSSSDHPNLSQVPPPLTVVVSPQVHVPQPTIARPRSSGHGQARPACTKPAFTPRPSLPSLHTLARMNVSVPGRKVPVPNPSRGVRPNMHNE